MQKMYKILGVALLVVTIACGSIVTMADQALAETMSTLQQNVVLRAAPQNYKQYAAIKSAQACADECAKEPLCVAVSYYSPRDICFLHIGYSFTLDMDRNYTSALKIWSE